MPKAAPCSHNPEKHCDECHLARERAYARRAYEKRREERQERARKYYHAHRDERLAFRAEYRAANPEKIAEGKKRHYEANKSQAAHSKRKLRGMIFLPGQTFESMFLEQGGLCAVCRRTLPEGKHCHVDHCHTTGHVRDLLCHSCNVGIGHFRDDPALLEAAAKYLREHAARIAALKLPE